MAGYPKSCRAHQAGHLRPRPRPIAFAPGRSCPKTDGLRPRLRNISSYSPDNHHEAYTLSNGCEVGDRCGCTVGSNFVRGGGGSVQPLNPTNTVPWPRPAGASPRGRLAWTCPPHFCHTVFLRLTQIRCFFRGWEESRGSVRP